MVKYDKYGRRTIPISVHQKLVDCIDRECARRKRSRNFILNEWIMEKCETLGYE